MLDWMVTLDASLFLQVNALPHPMWLTLVMRLVSAVSTGSMVWLLLALGLALTRDPAAALRTALALLVTTVATNGVFKPAVGRDRPDTTLETVRVYAGETPATPSFPSGHAATAGAGAYSLSRCWTPAPLWTLAMLVALSRLYLGVHYPLDLAVGLLVGVGCAMLVTGRVPYRVRADAGDAG